MSTRSELKSRLNIGNYSGIAHLKIMDYLTIGYSIQFKDDYVLMSKNTDCRKIDKNGSEEKVRPTSN